MRPRTTEEKNNFLIGIGTVALAALIIWLVSLLVTVRGTRQVLVDLALSMVLAVIICSGFFLARPGWFKRKWKQPQ